jgi:hypothetical protein
VICLGIAIGTMSLTLFGLYLALCKNSSRH